MTTVDAKMRKTRNPPQDEGRKSVCPNADASGVTANRGYSRPEANERLMELVVSRGNMWTALARVTKNKGKPGVDGMTVAALKPYLVTHWLAVKEELLSGRYKPSPVRKVEIPKPEGKGKRLLGIPTVLDRLIQQALHQVLTPIFDPDFSSSSYGFRPGRSAHQAVLSARAHVASGRRFVVDMDLEKFFDRVNHDVLMARVARKVGDKRVLGLIGRFLRAGLMAGGTVSQRKQGTPQGGPLSPLLSNILLDDLDKELERRGHAFCRYADDCNVYVKSRRAGERVLASLTRFLDRRLKLKVNDAKSAVDRPQKRTFLGYTMTGHPMPRLRVAWASAKRLTGKLKALLRRGRGRSLARLIEDVTPIVRGWMNYYRLAETKWVFTVLDYWFRHKLRDIVWRQWKCPRTRERKLMQRGIDAKTAKRTAYNNRGPWFNAGSSRMNLALPNAFFRDLGWTSFSEHLKRLQSIT